MSPDWQEFLTKNGARVNNQIVADFGHPDAELIAAREGTVIAPLGHLGLIEYSGNDAKAFLHSQLTSDVNHSNADAAQYSSWCSAKGRMLASFILYQCDADYFALLSADFQEFIQKRLQIYVFRSQVKIDNCSAEHEFIGLSGPQAKTLLQEAGLTIPAASMQTSNFTNGKVIRLDEERYIIVAKQNTVASIWQALVPKAYPVGSPAWQWLDIQRGIPWIVEATKEAFVPQMVNFDKIGGVSFNKGCYPGQEVVARTRYLGKVKRHLYRFHTSAPISAGASIHSTETPEPPCGMVVSAAPAPVSGYDGLAVILEDVINNGLKLNPSDSHDTDLTDIVAVG